jgi:DNA helicase-2/ATP-dependent DNA helicase PcrA
MLREPAYCERWQSKFDAILADEYQDVNFAQYCWLKALAKEHRNIFVVGDDDQSI